MEGWEAAALKSMREALGRGLHSSTFRLNISAFYGIGGECRGCLESVKEELRGNRGSSGYILCWKRLGLS